MSIYLHACVCAPICSTTHTDVFLYLAFVALCAVFSPESKEVMKRAIDDCLEVTPQGNCSTGPHGPIDKWDVSRVSNMEQLFQNATWFNIDLSWWDVSRVTTMRRMFYNANSFAQTLCGKLWVTSTATQVQMFDGSSGSISTTICGTRSLDLFRSFLIPRPWSLSLRTSIELLCKRSLRGHYHVF